MRSGGFLIVAALWCSFVSAFSQSHAARQTGPIGFDLAGMFSTGEVVLVGWEHIHHNWKTPTLIYEELDQIRKNLVIVTEDTPIRPIETCVSTTRGVEYTKMILKAQSLDIPIVGGELPLPPLEAEMSPGRDASFAANIEKFVKQRKKVLLIVGAAHIRNVSRILLERGIKSRSIDTRVVFDTEKTTLNALDRAKRLWKWSGQEFGSQPNDKELKEIDPRLFECPRLTCQQQGNSKSFCEKHFPELKAGEVQGVLK